MTIDKPTPDAVECRELRTFRSKTFRLPCGSMQCEARRDAVCYTSDEGVLRSCDTTVKQADGRVFVEWLPYKFELHKTGVGFEFQSRESGFARVSLVGIGGEEFDTKAALKPVVEGDTITFVEVRPGVDIVFRILPLRVKTLRIVKEENAARTFEWFCEHDLDGRDKVDDTLTGVDAAGNRLDLSVEASPIDETSFRMAEAWSGQVALRDPTTRIKTLSDKVTYPVEIDPTVSVGIAADVNDGSQFGGNDPWYSAAPNNIYMGMKTAGSLAYNPGWSFLPNVPQGVTITSATITVLSLNGNTGTAKFYGEAADNPATFSSSRKPTQLAKTTAFNQNAIIPSVSNAFNVAGAVQEIVSRSGWTANNRMNLFGLAVATGLTPGFGLLRDYHNSNTTCGQLSITYTVPPVSAAITGTATASITEADIVTGGKTIIVTLTNDTWVAAGATFDAQRQAIINGIDSAQAEATGWDAVVKATQGVSGVVRTSNTVVTITLDAQATYNITAAETITVTVPSASLTGAGGAVVASPTLTVSPVASRPKNAPLNLTLELGI